MCLETHWKPQKLKLPLAEILLRSLSCDCNKYRKLRGEKGAGVENKYLRNDNVRESKARLRGIERTPPAVGEITARCKRADGMIVRRPRRAAPRKLCREATLCRRLQARLCSSIYKFPLVQPASIWPLCEHNHEKLTTPTNQREALWKYWQMYWIFSIFSSRVF